ncbi:MAG: helix-turn-helix domain-containing protein [Bacteroidetes bacterium]|nr:helix-turn-helix domain-containing protein [Bacteroidota bacterium]
MSRREIGRIERGEIAIPHNNTLLRIAETLGVRPDELETY